MLNVFENIPLGIELLVYIWMLLEKIIKIIK